MTEDVRIERATPDDLDAVLALLTEHGLPPDGLADHFASAIVARHAGHVVGSAALEIYPDGALLRSVAVSESLRTQGLGGALTRAAVDLALSHHVPAIFLLTTTAERYFPKFGFEPIRREDVPATVRTSVEFRFACCASAIVMRKRL